MPGSQSAQIDIVDATWIGAAPDQVARHVGEPANWRRWWPELELLVTDHRGIKGVKWVARGPAVAGRMEVWLQPQFDGTVAHYFLAVDVTDVTAGPRQAARLARGYRSRTKSMFWELGDLLEPDRGARLVAVDSPAERPFVL